ncbi:ATP-binding protein [Streptomyces luteireticuli]|uniref:ATP-binding protein n=1 Tax=Streptomyces luteireticuli TaxID=173858 RepID=A0ABP3I5I0_9ACTN
MSLPLTRRIAQAALLVAASAGAAAGAAGAASADTLKAPDALGAVSMADGAQLGNKVDAVSHQAGALTTDAGNKVVHTALPATQHALGTAGTTGKSALESTQHTTGQLAGQAGQAVGGAAQGVAKSGGNMPAGGNVTKALPHLGG